MAVAILAQGYNFEQNANPKHTKEIPLVHGSGARLIELDFSQDPADTDELGPLSATPTRRSQVDR